MMDVTPWFTELEMEEPQEFGNRHQPTFPYNNGSRNSYYTESFKGYTNLINQSIEATTINGDIAKHQDYKVMETIRLDPSHGSSSKNFTISFGTLTPSPETNPRQPHRLPKELYSHKRKAKENLDFDEFCRSMELTQRVSSKRRNHRQAQEHVFSERKRREKLAQRFNILYALLPHLKKMDKATVLEDASKYIEELQKRIKELEELEVKGKRIVQKSGVSIGRSKINGGLVVKDDTSSSEANKAIHSSHTEDPEIVVRISGASILVRIYCQRNPSLVLKALNEMERLNLAAISSRVLPFSETMFLITITAQMTAELLTTAMDLVERLQSALRNYV